MTDTSTVRDHIIKALKTLGKPSTPSEIADAAGQVPGSVTSDLSKALNDPQQFSPFKRVGKADEHLYDLNSWAHTLPSPTADQLSIEDELTLEDELVTFLLNLPEIIQAETSDIEVIQAFAAQAADPQRLLKYRPSDLRPPLYRALERAVTNHGIPVLTYKSTDSYETLVKFEGPRWVFQPVHTWMDGKREATFVAALKLSRLPAASYDSPRLYVDSEHNVHRLTPPHQTVKPNDVAATRTAAGPDRLVTLHALGTVTPDAHKAARELNVTIINSTATWREVDDAAGSSLGSFEEST